MRLPNPIPPPGNFLEDAPRLEDLFTPGFSSSNKPSTCSTLGAVASTEEKIYNVLLRNLLLIIHLFQIPIVAKERKIALLREHMFTVFVMSVMHLRFYWLSMSYKHEMYPFLSKNIKCDFLDGRNIFDGQGDPYLLYLVH